MNEPESGTLDTANAAVNKVTACGIIDMGQSLLISALQQDINMGTPVSAPRYVVGSPAHTAPELYSSLPSGQASDIYALGTLMWQIASRQNTEPLHHGEDPIPFEVPEEFQQLYKRCWGPPGQRPSARDVWTTLQDVWGEFMYFYDEDGNPTDAAKDAKMVMDSKASLPLKDVILHEEELGANRSSSSKKHRLADGVSWSWQEWHANLSQ
jgi:serine/threonine protein kinase